MTYGVRAPFRERWARFTWNVTHLFSNLANPYVIQGQGDLEPKRRTALEDITHSFKDLFVRQK